MNEFVTDKLFSSLNLIPEILSNLNVLGFEQMTSIQEKSLPVILQGNDVIAQAKTGSGKTAAFGLGILNKIKLEKLKPQSLILCPTRELAEQVAEEIRRLARGMKNCKVLVVCGGTSEYQQVNSLEHGIHIIVGTPGRVLKLLKQGTVKLEDLDLLVLDEADRMLDMGFSSEMEAISTFLPKGLQTLLFSATFQDEIEKLSLTFQKNPTRVTVESIHDEGTIDQVFIQIEDPRNKEKAVLQILGFYEPETVIIFCKTKQGCADLSKYLNNHEIASLAFHGDLDQNERTVVLTKFSNHSALVLIATDVAARGLDIKNLSAVINYDLPIDAETYTHRIGRTARAGKVGVAISLITQYDQEKVLEIKNTQNKSISNLTINEIPVGKKYTLRPLMKTIYINGGKQQKIRAGDILGAIVNVAGIDASRVGNINILNTQSYVAVNANDAEVVVEKLNNEKIKGRKFRLGIA